MKFKILFFFFMSFTFGSFAQHPNLLFKNSDQAALREGIQKYPLFRQSFEKLQNKAKQALKEGIIVPMPQGQDGSFSHNQHKKNYMEALACGVTYHITGDTAYGGFVRDLLMKYAGMYEQLPIHPAHVPGHAAGKIFWQNLNDCVWQVYMIQAYDCVYHMLTPDQRSRIEQHLFTPIVQFLMVDNKEVFDQIHNHGTWNDAAVGITGYVMNRSDWVKKAIYGSNLDSKTGFLAQINQLFSPDGYYTEGPYYQRYALMPFMVFAMAIQQYQPDIHIFAYRDSLLNKSVHTCLQLSYNKHLFPFNDDIKDKTYVTEELIYGVDIAYNYGHQDPGLLSIVQDQKSILISDLGLKLAQDIAAGKKKPFNFHSGWFTDGPAGDKGGIGVLRYREAGKDFAAAIKATSLGMGHGHFDKLNLLVYDNKEEIISDYGSARYINIASKDGGRYLPENNSWAKQTIAHNTVTVDQRSNYQGKRTIGEDKYSYLVYKGVDTTAFNKNDKDMGGNVAYQVISCADTSAYPGVKMQRTIILLREINNQDPLLIDVFCLEADKPHRYDLPYYYNGEIIAASVPLERATKLLEPLGTKNGYQYLWKTGSDSGAQNATNTKNATAPNAFTFLQVGKFYTLTTASKNNVHYDLVMTGAGDPNHNLRTQKGLIQTINNQKDMVFLNVLEPHGRFDYSSETTKGATSSVTELKLLQSSRTAVEMLLKTQSGSYHIHLNLNDKSHFIEIN